jgi:hypothetical protein
MLYILSFNILTAHNGLKGFYMVKKYPQKHSLVRSLLFLILVAFSLHSRCSQFTCETCGSEPASQWYQETIKKFLDYLHIDKPVHIYKLDLDKKPDACAKFCLRAPHNLWLNEVYFEHCLPEPYYKLWSLAKGILYYVQDYENNAKRIASTSLNTLIPVLPSVACGALGASAVHYFDSEVPEVQILAGALCVCSELCAGLIPMFTEELYHIINNRAAKTLGKESDLRAAQMLFDLGHFAAVKSIVERLSEEKAEIVEANKPSVVERIAYLQEFIKTMTGAAIPIGKNICVQQAQDSYCVSSEAVSPWYKEKVHEFLGYLQVKNPRDIPVYKYDEIVDTSLAHATSCGIGINEAAIQAENLSVHEKILDIAHEASHYALQHSAKETRERLIKRGLWYFPQGISLLGGILGLLNWGHNVPFYGKLLIGGGIGLASGLYTVNRLNKLPQEMNAFVKSHEKEADLCAARMLCEHGYRADIEGYVQEKAALIQAGRTGVLSKDHPSLYERHAYLRDFMTQWNQQHQKMILSDN